MTIVDCPRCAAAFKVQPSVISVRCPQCGQRIELDNDEPAPIRNSVQTIQQTGKQWKAIQAIGALALMICGIGACGGMMAKASEGAIFGWMLGVLFSLALFFGGRIGAWWEHG